MSTTRRHFLGAAAGIGLAAELQAQEQTRVSPNDRVQVALIGNGIQGNSDARSSLGVGGVEMVACADVYEGRLTRAKEMWGNQVFKECKDLLETDKVILYFINTLLQQKDKRYLVGMIVMYTL